MPGFTFGCDPELFIVDIGGNPVPASRFIPGTKESPFAVPMGAIQVDGMAAEFNINPVDNYHDFNYNCSVVVNHLSDRIGGGFHLSDKPTVEFSEKEWEDAPPMAKEMGCTPDFNAWTGDVNPPPDVGDSRVRSAGGHIHIGWTEGAVLSDEKHVQNCRDLVKQLDWYVGAWGARVDTDPTRRKLYGRAGACRYKDYGVEYRVPSNFWALTPSRRLLLWNRVQAAIWGMRDSFMPALETIPTRSSSRTREYHFKADVANEMVINAINTSERSKSLEDAYKFPIWDVDARHVEL